LETFCQGLISILDALFLSLIITAAQFYFFDLECQNVNLDDFACFILIFALMSNCKNEISRLIKDIEASSYSHDRIGFRSAQTVALVLASQFSYKDSNFTLGSDRLRLLEWATRFGYTELVLLLLEMRGDIQRPFEDHSSELPKRVLPLCLAAQHGQGALVQSLLESGVDIARNTAALHKAAFHGHKEIVWLLVKRGAEVESKSESEDGLTALQFAAAGARASTARLLIELGADIAGRNHEGLTPLHLAVGFKNYPGKLRSRNINQEEMLIQLELERNRIEVIQLLLENGAIVAAMDKNGRTALHSAIEAENESAVPFLIKKGADNKAWKNRPKRMRMIHHAAANGFREAVQVLLEMGRDVNELDKKERTPLYHAAANGHLATARLLLEKGADIDAQNSVHWTPLHSAANGGHLSVINLLLEKKAAVNPHSGDFHETPLHCAIKQGCGDRSRASKNVSRLLLEKGVDIEAHDIETNPPLHLAAEWSVEKLVQILLDSGADIEAQDCTGSTPFHWAVYRAHEDIYSAERETPDLKQYVTASEASHWTYYDREAVVRLLLERGAKVTVQDSRGRTPFVMVQWCAYNIPKLYPEHISSSPSSSLSA